MPTSDPNGDEPDGKRFHPWTRLNLAAVSDAVRNYHGINSKFTSIHCLRQEHADYICTCILRQPRHVLLSSRVDPSATFLADLYTRPFPFLLESDLWTAYFVEPPHVFFSSRDYSTALSDAQFDLRETSVTTLTFSRTVYFC